LAGTLWTRRAPPPRRWPSGAWAYSGGASDGDGPTAHRRTSVAAGRGSRRTLREAAQGRSQQPTDTTPPADHTARPASGKAWAQRLTETGEATVLSGCWWGGTMPYSPKRAQFLPPDPGGAEAHPGPR